MNVEFQLRDEDVSALQQFIQSDFFSNRDVDLSPYWKFQSKMLKAKFQSEKLTVGGKSGFYIPPKRNKGKETDFKRFNDRVDESIEIKKHNCFNFDYFEAFNLVMRNDSIIDPDNSLYRVNHEELAKHSKTWNTVEDILKFHTTWSDYMLSQHTVIAYYLTNLLISHLHESSNKSILEIGAGSGLLASVLKKIYSPNYYIIVDLPQSIINSYVYLKEHFKESEFILPHQINSKVFTYPTNKDSSFIFLVPSQQNVIPKDFCDLSINSHSFQEMNTESIARYFELVNKCTKSMGHFLCVNRLEKIPIRNEKRESNIPPNRFYDYPWDKKNHDLINEISRPHRLCQRDNVGIRLQKNIK